MEEDQDLRFVCKLCNKKYPCGKSLGGHMRSHVIATSAESEEKFEPTMKNISSLGMVVVGGSSSFQQNNSYNSFTKDSKLAEFGNGPQSGYGLRENPKKTWRAVDSTLPSPQEKICKQCGKGFQSLKALCGHMACHVDRGDKGLKDDHSWTSENHKLVLDSHSDTEEAEDMRLRTRSSSRSKRYKKVEVKSTSFSLANNGSSSVSEIDGLEQEEIALCLMLLSRDSVNKGGVNSVVESSDNNSVVLETISSSIDMRIGKREGLIQERDIAPKIVDCKLKAKAAALDDDDGIVQIENSDSGYFLDEYAKAESDVSVDGFRRNGGFEYGKGFSKFRKHEYYDDDDDDDDDDDYEGGGTGSSIGRNDESRKRKYENVEFWKDSCEVSAKRNKYECFNCKKVFKSYQALGGHRPCHKRMNSYCESRFESLDDSTDYRTMGNLVETTSKKKSSTKNSSLQEEKKPKPKKHICPFCNRVFKNGQALGGHKRSHFLAGHVETSNRPNPVVKPEVHDLLDLNLPAPEEDVDDVGQGQFLPC